MKFSEIQWGQDEAKGDEDLINYFVPFPDFDSIKSGSSRYVIGRKGAGKTAVIERLRLEADDNPLAFHSSLTLRNFPIHDLRDLRDKSYRDKSQFVPAWLFLIYVEVAKLSIEDQGAHPREIVEELNHFLEINNLNHAIGFSETITELKKSESKIKILAKWFEGEKLTSQSQQSEIFIHYNKVVAILGGKLKQLKTEAQYWLFMDELDEGYRAGDSNLRLVLLALLRAVEDSALALKNCNINYRPVLVLRSDIFDRLEDNDLNKLDDFIIRLKWTSKDDSDSYALKNIATARILHSFPGAGGDAWSAVVNNNDKALPDRVSSIWQYMANRTYERPRDIIKFLKFCKNQSRGDKLNFSEVKNAEDLYSDWL